MVQRDALVSPPETSEEAIKRMQRETDAILATSVKLLKELEELLETRRQLQAAQAALLELRRKQKSEK